MLTSKYISVRIMSYSYTDYLVYLIEYKYFNLLPSYLFDCVIFTCKLNISQ